MSQKENKQSTGNGIRDHAKSLLEDAERATRRKRIVDQLSPPKVLPKSKTEEDDEEEDDYDFGIDFQGFDDQANKLINSIRNEEFTPTKSKTVKKIELNPSFAPPSDDDVSDIRNPSSDDGSDVHDEDDMADEILRLNNLTASLKQEMDNQSVNSMISALSNGDINHSQRSREKERSYKYSGEQLGLRKRPTKIKRAQLYKKRNEEVLSGPLVFFTLLIWGVLFVLANHISHGEMTESGKFQSLPDIFQNMIDLMATSM